MKYTINKPYSESASVLVEFALVLPFLLIGMSAVIDFSLSGRYESGIIRALGAANRSVMASAGDSTNDDLACAQAAGREFLDVLRETGAMREAEFAHPGITEPAILGLAVFEASYIPVPPGAFDLPAAPLPDNKDPIELRASFTQRCYFCAMADTVMGMFSAELFVPKNRFSLVSVSAPGGCYPKSGAGGCSFPGPAGDPVDSAEWANSGRQIILDRTGALWCCDGQQCTSAGSV